MGDLPGVEARADDLIRRTTWFRRYAKAFETVTGMKLHAVSGHWLADRAGKWEAIHPFCRAFHGIVGTPCSCRRTLIEIAENRAGGSRGTLMKVRCPAGLSVYALPVDIPVPDGVLLVTGRVLETRPGPDAKKPFRQGLADLLVAFPSGDRGDVAQLERKVRVVPTGLLHAQLQLMGLIAAELTLLADRFIERTRAVENAAIRKAKEIIDAGHVENLHLPATAKACGMSPYHFSRVFHRETGLTFSTYLNRARIENMKRLLGEPARSVAEAAFQAGFQSISQANRAFRAATGKSPTAYRRGRAEAGRPWHSG
jgi:AraC-like DNA-binding protein